VDDIKFLLFSGFGEKCLGVAYRLAPLSLRIYLQNGISARQCIKQSFVDCDTIFKVRRASLSTSPVYLLLYFWLEILGVGLVPLAVARDFYNLQIWALGLVLLGIDDQAPTTPRSVFIGEIRGFNVHYICRKAFFDP